MGKIVKTVVATAVALAALGGLLVALFIDSGIYPIAANDPHFRIERWILTTAQREAVQNHAQGLQAPPLRDAALIRRGFVLYREHCLVCHGAPGEPQALLGRGMNPNPPPLFMAASEWSDAELYWIIRNGLKMAGMPAFFPGLPDSDLWALTAFTRRLPELSVQEYRTLAAASEGRAPDSAAEWVDRDDPGFARLQAEGRPERGRELIARFGCGSCHVIPGVAWARGRTGPPLTRWAERHFIAGGPLNTPDNLVHWIVDPQAVEPGTAMPDLGVSPEEARHIAAYLFTLGKSPLAAGGREGARR